jgi:hypothetical protein
MDDGCPLAASPSHSWVLAPRPAGPLLFPPNQCSCQLLFQGPFNLIPPREADNVKASAQPQFGFDFLYQMIFSFAGA